MNLVDLPRDLPVPVDDGAARHLEGLTLPALAFAATDGTMVEPGARDGWTVIYVYPMTGRPDTPLPDDWDEIPGARGCTPQSCSFRDHHDELSRLGSAVYGLSAQTTVYQQEAKHRLHLPFELLSDAGLALKEALHLPTFEAGGMVLYKRITLIAQGATIRKVFYPVFPPHANADEVLAWLRKQAGSHAAPGI